MSGASRLGAGAHRWSPTPRSHHSPEDPMGKRPQNRRPRRTLPHSQGPTHRTYHHKNHHHKGYLCRKHHVFHELLRCDPRASRRPGRCGCSQTSPHSCCRPTSGPPTGPTAGRQRPPEVRPSLHHRCWQRSRCYRSTRSRTARRARPESELPSA